MKTLNKILDTLEKIKTDIRFLSEASSSRYKDIYKSVEEYKKLFRNRIELFSRY